jgi:hypothetical protein
MSELGRNAPNSETLYFAHFWNQVLVAVSGISLAMFTYHLTVASIEAWRTVRGGAVR